MRSRIIGFVIGCGLAAAVVVPALACPYQAQASSDQKPQQTAQAQPSSDTRSQ